MARIPACGVFAGIMVPVTEELTEWQRALVLRGERERVLRAG